MTSSTKCFIFITALLSVFIFIFIRILFSIFEDDKVINLPGQPHVDFNQYAGYLAVDVNQHRNLFYYFVEAEDHPRTKPVVLWLHGGPGCSAVGEAAFSHHGPFKPTNKGILVKNPYSWNKEANMLYLDSPAGVGFSYSTNTSNYLFVNDESVARDHLVFLRHWFSKFPNYRTNEFFIAGESYAGHFAPQLAQLILQTKAKFNLKGIAIGNPLLEFDTDYNSSMQFLNMHGQISDRTYEMFNSICSYPTMRKQMRAGTLSTSCSKVNLQMTKEVNAYTNTFNVIADTCLVPPEKQGYLTSKEQAGEKTFVCIRDDSIAYMNKKNVQKALHAKLVGVKIWSTCSSVLRYDSQNYENPTISMLGTLVKLGVRVLAFSGDLDSIIPFKGTRSLLDELAKIFGLNITRPYEAWFQGGQVAGWTEVYGDILTFATIKGAGHSTTISQPERSLEMLRAFLKGKPLPNRPK